MRVSVEQIIPDIELGNEGLLLRIRNEDKSNVGKLWVGQAKIKWARGSKPKKTAKVITVKQLVDYLDSLP
jgi:hypothetical protein